MRRLFYKGAAHYGISPDIKIKFNFIGSKLRIIGFKNTKLYRCPSVDVYIDGVESGSFSEVNDSLVFQALCFSVEDLADKEHFRVYSFHWSN